MEKIQQKTVVTQVMDRIKELIASGKYQVNDRIPTESELADMFGVGRSSVREAIKIFQHLGVLEARVPKGTFVCDRSKISQEAITWSILLGQDSLSEIIELRHIIEKAGVAALVGELSNRSETGSALIGRMRDVVASMKEGAETSSVEELVQADYDFHATIIAASGNSLYSSIYQTLHSFMQEEIRRTYIAISDMSEIVEDHLGIIDSIVSGELARALTRHDEHFMRIRRLLQEATASTQLRKTP
ncbi:MAG TPA: GntR family transcriptional regulator [Spirochaetia bacterium]|nr:GntR family transcriptional regulator [Spirochaetia bacterium]